MLPSHLNPNSDSTLIFSKPWHQMNPTVMFVYKYVCLSPVPLRAMCCFLWCVYYTLVAAITLFDTCLCFKPLGWLQFSEREKTMLEQASKIQKTKKNRIAEQWFQTNKFAFRLIL